jgi:hypothetical protein
VASLRSITASSVSSVRKATLVVCPSTSDIRSSIWRSPKTNWPSMSSPTATWMSTLPPRAPNTITRPASSTSEATLDWMSCHMIRRPGSFIRQSAPPKNVASARPPITAAVAQSTPRTSRRSLRQPATARPAASSSEPTCTRVQTVS